MRQMIEAVESDKGGRPLEVLRATGLDAPILDEDDRRWRQLQCEPAPGIDLRDRFRGALVGGAIGDAMGRPNEGIWPSEARARCIREYQPWRGYRSGPKGTITDDTQITMWLTASLLGASHDPRTVSRKPSERTEGHGSGGVGETGARGEATPSRRILDT